MFNIVLDRKNGINFAKSYRVVGNIARHNREMVTSAEFRAREMDTWPSPLEERMKDLLERYNIKYDSQKIFYIYDKDGWIIRYYIADFFVPDKGIIIEVDGKFHDRQKQKDKKRTREIEENYPGVTVVRWKSEDFRNSTKVTGLISKLKSL